MSRSSQSSRPDEQAYDDWLRCEAFQIVARAASESPPGPLAAWQKKFVEQQLRFRGRMRRRFPVEQSWLWTDRSLSQASDWWSALYKASLFPGGVSVLDACCGAGADSVAIGRRGPVIAMDACCETLAIAEANLLGHLESDAQAEVLLGDFPNDTPESTQWMHADPDRRPPDKSAADRRTLIGDQFQPSLGSLLQFAENLQGAVIKIAPSTVFSDETQDAVDGQSQRVWLGTFGECRQQLLLCGKLRRENVGTQRRVVLVHPEPAEFTGDIEMASTWADQPSRYIYDLNPTLFASELQVCWANQNGLAPLGGELGYYTSEQLVRSPFAQVFQWVETIAWDDRKVRKWLRANKAGIVDVKTRGVRLDAGHFQRRYSNSEGDAPFSILVSQLGQRVKAVVCKRI